MDEQENLVNIMVQDTELDLPILVVRSFEVDVCVRGLHFFKNFPDVSRCSMAHNSLFVSRCFMMFTDVYRHIQTFTDIYRHLQTFTDINGHVYRLDLT